MKRVFLLYFFLLAFAAGAQHNALPPKFLSKDSLPLGMKTWLYEHADRPEMATKEYNDSGWKVIDAIAITRDTPGIFQDYGWFRRHFIIDTSLLNTPMAISVSHLGASEIYLDGKLIMKYGEIKGADSTEYYDPQEIPVIILLHDTGRHVLAVRYANYETRRNSDIYGHDMGGFSMRLSEADSAIENEVDRAAAITFVLIFLSSIFGTLALLHLLLFLYYRTEKSNLYFSIFAFCVATLFICVFVSVFSSDPLLQMQAKIVTVPLVALIFLALSGVVNALFSRRRKTRFYILAALCLIMGAMRFVFSDYLGYAMFISITAVLLEMIVLIIWAMVKRVKGARIIGFGLLFFALLLLTLVLAIVLSGGSFDIDDSTAMGQILLLLIVGAILSIPLSMSAYQAWNFARLSKDLKKQLEQVQLLSEKTLQQEQEKQRLLENRKEELEQQVALRTEQLMVEKKKSDDLLLNILPGEVAEELKEYGSAKAKQYNHVSVLFTDFVNFTGISEQMDPEELVAEIDRCFKAFDEIIGRNGLEKIKTIGDAYLAVCGLPHENPLHAQKTVKAATEIRDFMMSQGGRFQIRVGINSGPVVAGIVGVKKFAYDIWGDTVNTAARMEQNSDIGKINISGSTYELVKNDFHCTHRGKIEAKNKGEIDMYFVEG